MKAAVAIGGMSALSACARLSDNEVGASTPQFPQGPSNPDAVPPRQHTWSEYLVTNRHDNVVPPRHHAFVFLEYRGEGRPTEDDRETAERAFQTLEHAFQRGTGGRPNVIENDGLLFMIGYSPAYFDRFDEALPESIDLPPPEQVLTALDDDPGKADAYDALLHLASDRAQIVLSAEEGLFGDLDVMNGRELDVDLTDVFERVDRRAGFVGAGLPSDRLDEEAVPEEAPASMGFTSKFADTVPSEDKMTIQEGPFAGGTTQHISKLEIDLERWYEHDQDERVHRMFSPEYTPEDVGHAGEALGRDSRVTIDLADQTETDAEQRGVVGHSQKTARARDEDFEPVILRRGDFNAPADPGSVLHFGSIQEGIDDFIRTRKAMDDIGFDDDAAASSVPSEADGILAFIDVEQRANFLIPPRALRALPSPRP